MSVQIVSASGKNLAQPIAVGSNLTTTPLATLHVLYNATEVDAFRVDDTVNDTTPFVITGQGQGYVGIGVLDPQAKLDVAGDAHVSGTLVTSNLQVLGTQTTVNTYTTLSSNINIDNQVGLGPALSVSQAGTGSQYAVAEFFDSDVSTTVPALVVANGGSVGIGTTSPIATLDVLCYIYSRNETFDNILTLNATAGAFGAIEAMNQADTIKHPVCLCPWGGNVGIGTTQPVATLDVAGGLGPL